MSQYDFPLNCLILKTRQLCLVLLIPFLVVSFRREGRHHSVNKNNITKRHLDRMRTVWFAATAAVRVSFFLFGDVDHHNVAPNSGDHSDKK